jgi:MoaA/NifB/PqqE/SkfB family radical SAM enzyme
MAYASKSFTRTQPDEMITVTLDQGFHEQEWDGAESFRWMSCGGRASFEPADDERYLELWLFCQYGDLSQRLTVTAGDLRETLDLVHGWSPVSLIIPAGIRHAVFEVNRPFHREHHTEDNRELAVRVRMAGLHADHYRHIAMRRQWSNSVLNAKEMLAGETVLASTPPFLGIDLHGTCNIDPPCVFCEWDYAKKMEGPNARIRFSMETLASYGEFFENAADLVNCSIGEPFMMPDLDDILSAIGDRGKRLEMATNGQILTERNIQRLLGRNIELYVSIDAATPETYARLRNNGFMRVIQNTRRLTAARKEHGGLPKVYLVFMPMQANAHEIELFVQLCADLEVDKLVLRPLNPTSGNSLEWIRAGYHFKYEDEQLSLDRLAVIARRASDACHKKGVHLANQLDFGGLLEGVYSPSSGQGQPETAQECVRPSSSCPASAEAPNKPESISADVRPAPSLGFEAWPLCTEPWRNLYILRRGLRPCCYGGASIGPMNGVHEAWNSSLLQEIRRSLTRGAFHDYCLLSPACPIVRKTRHAGGPVPGGSLRVRLWRLWMGLNRRTKGVPRLFLHTIRRFLRRDG